MKEREDETIAVVAHLGSVALCASILYRRPVKSNRAEAFNDLLRVAHLSASFSMAFPGHGRTASADQKIKVSTRVRLHDSLDIEALIS